MIPIDLSGFSCISDSILAKGAPVENILGTVPLETPLNFSNSFWKFAVYSVLSRN